MLLRNQSSSALVITCSIADERSLDKQRYFPIFCLWLCDSPCMANHITTDKCKGLVPEMNDLPDRQPSYACYPEVGILPAGKTPTAGQHNTKSTMLPQANTI